MFLLYYIKQGLIDVPHVVGRRGVLQGCYATKRRYQLECDKVLHGGWGGVSKWQFFPLRTFRMIPNKSCRHKLNGANPLKFYLLLCLLAPLFDPLLLFITNIALGVEALFLQHTILCPTMDTNTFVSGRIKRKLDLRVAGHELRTNVTFVSSIETMSRTIFIIYQKNFQFYSTTVESH